MIDCKLFFNSRVADENLLNMADAPVAVGDWFLTPVRCLFNGDRVAISSSYLSGNKQVINHSKEYVYWGEDRRTLLKVASSIVLLIPGLIIGSAFKGLGYLSKSIRERHNLFVQHYTPIVETVIGSENERLNLEEIKRKLVEQREENTLNRSTKALIIYAQPNTVIKEDPGILSLNPEKLILVGAHLIHGPSAIGCMDESLSSSWGNLSPPTIKNARRINTGFAIQWKVNSVSEAIKDTLPRKSLFSFERYKRIYVV